MTSPQSSATPATSGPRRRTPLREAQKHLTRETLIEAALEAFSDDGYVDVTVDDIARRAGASRATFYLHFESKAAILHAVLRKMGMREEFRTLLDHFRAIDDPTVDALEAWLEEYVDFYQKHVGIHRALHQAQAIEPEFTDLFLQGVQEYINMWGTLGFISNPDSDDLKLAAIMMFTMAEQVMYLSLVHGFALDRARVTRALAESFYTTLNRH